MLSHYIHYTAAAHFPEIRDGSVVNQNRPKPFRRLTRYPGYAMRENQRKQPYRAKQKKRSVTYSSVGVPHSNSAEEVPIVSPHEAEDEAQKQRVVLPRDVEGEDEEPTVLIIHNHAMGGIVRALAIRVASAPPPRLRWTTS